MIIESVLTQPEIAPPLVSVCGPEGYTPEQWAQMATHQLISIADTALPPLREQAYAYRERMFLIIAETVRQALNQDRQRSN